ncbi:MAG: RNA polymerase sigma factor [Planctomycetes bacterium]|nr:RNA polymerase sigma factor [Planctomycetota bacterium]
MDDGDGVNDAMLVARALEGDRASFGRLADRYFRMLWVLAYQKTQSSADADDLVQEALVRGYRSLSTLRDPERFGAWLYNIAFKLCLDWLRKKKRSKDVVLNEQVLAHAHSGRIKRQAVEANLEDAEQRDRVMAAVGALSDKYRLVITLRYVNRLSYQEIADHLGEPMGTIANRLHRATHMLREQLTAEGEPAHGRDA